MQHLEPPHRYYHSEDSIGSLFDRRQHGQSSLLVHSANARFELDQLRKGVVVVVCCFRRTRQMDIVEVHAPGQLVARCHHCGFRPSLAALLVSPYTGRMISLYRCVCGRTNGGPLAITLMTLFSAAAEGNSRSVGSGAEQSETDQEGRVALMLARRLPILGWQSTRCCVHLLAKQASSV
jgi:hypothetical protein